MMVTKHITYMLYCFGGLIWIVACDIISLSEGVSLSHRIQKNQEFDTMGFCPQHHFPRTLPLFSCCAHHLASVF